jgi:hypothetical protein
MKLGAGTQLYPADEEAPPSRHDHARLPAYRRSGIDGSLHGSRIESLSVAARTEIPHVELANPSCSEALSRPVHGADSIVGADAASGPHWQWRDTRPLGQRPSVEELFISESMFVTVVIPYGLGMLFRGSRSPSVAPSEYSWHGAERLERFSTIPS